MEVVQLHLWLCRIGAPCAHNALDRMTGVTSDITQLRSVVFYGVTHSKGFPTSPNRLFVVFFIAFVCAA